MSLPATTQTTAIDRSTPDALRAAYIEATTENPKARLRDVADQLGVSEAELVDCGAEAPSRRLAPNWRELLLAMPTLGKVMVLTRNASCVHERKGRFEDVSVNPHGALVLGPDIDLRIFLNRWHFGFAVQRTLADGAVRRSLQFFDRDGLAVFKLFLTDDSDVAAYDALVAKHLEGAPVGRLDIKAYPAGKRARADGEIDVEGLRTAWRNMKDTHEFFGMLRKFDVGRTQALRLVGGEFADRIAASGFNLMLQAAAKTGDEIMIFVGSPGCIQIHTGKVSNIKPLGPWINVLDPDLNLHLRGDRIAETWVVRKPTSDGVVTSLEIFDHAGETIALAFGKRKPGQPELARWRDLIAMLPRVS
ncbi:MAG: hemin-degrading factor [Alphaproteobacteria bacterium]